MSGKWSIDVAAGRAVLESVRSSMVGLEDDLAALGSAVGGVLGAVPAAVVQEAFAEAMAQGVEPAVRGMFASSNSALEGTSGAISAYERGDLFMAAAAARSAAGVAPVWNLQKPVNPNE